MKKFASALAATALVAGSAIALATPAHAGTTDGKVGICHATSAANGHYTFNLISPDATANGHFGTDHQEGRDIIPAYSWVDKDKVRQYFPGQNLDKVSYIKYDAQGNGSCEVPTVPAEPVTAGINPPTYIPASCARPDYPFGTVVVPTADGEGIVGHDGPFLNPEATEWSVQYKLAADTAETDWSWPAGQDGLFKFTVVPLTADPNYVVDSKTGVGACELPNTGAMDYMPLVGGAVVIGAAGIYLRRRFA